MENVVQQKILNLGKRICHFRLHKNDTQEDFAARIGVSLSTLKRMERGDVTVAIGRWVKALDLLGRIDDVDLILKPTQSRLDGVFAPKQKIRKRAGRK